MQYKSTIRACFAGYVVQAVVNNFVPLLFLTFQSQYGIPLSQVTLLITSSPWTAFRCSSSTASATAPQR